MNSTTPLFDNSTSSDVDSMNRTGFANDLTFTDVITLNPYFYGSSIIIIIILVSCIITFIFIIKNKPKLLLSTHQT